MTKIEKYREQIVGELQVLHRAKFAKIDVLIVVHNQLEYFKECIHSLMPTPGVELYIHDNGSDDETRDYINHLPRSHKFIHCSRSETNLGFIRPNNEMFHRSTGDYVVVLNSDTLVLPGWNRAMTGYLDEHPEVTQVGYGGSKLDHEGIGADPAYGEEPDYLAGWCFCVRRKSITTLFDEEHLKFAYGEDSDLSLRIRESGGKIHGLHLDLVQHHGGKTTEQVGRVMGNELLKLIEANHRYIAQRWAKYLPQKPA